MDDKHYLDYLEAGYKDEQFIKTYEMIFRPYPEIHRINGLPVHFDPNAKNLLVSLSGGADSSILTYMLCDYIEKNNYNNKIYCMTLVRFWKEKPWLAPMAEDVYNYLKARFPDIIQEQIWGFLPPEFEDVPLTRLGKEHLFTKLPREANCDVLCTLDFQEYVMYRYNIDLIYTGITMNPPFATDDEPTFRNEEFMKDNWDWAISGPAINPFGLLRKNYTMAQYHNYDQWDLLKLTRSCEGDIAEFGEENRRNRQYPPECGHCFFCQEKKWGLDNCNGFLLENL